MADFWEFCYYFLKKLVAWSGSVQISGGVTLTGFIVAVSVFGVVISTLLSYGRFVSRRDFNSLRGSGSRANNDSSNNNV